MSEDRSVLGHLERVPVRPTFHFSGFFFFFFLPISQFLPNAHKEQKILGGGDLTLLISPTKKTEQFWCWHVNNQSMHIPSVWVTASCPPCQSSPFPHPLPRHSNTLPPPPPFYKRHTFCDLFFLPRPNFALVLPGWWEAWVNKRRWTQEPDSNCLYSLNPILHIMRLNCLFSKRKTNRKVKEKIPVFYR